MQIEFLGTDMVRDAAIIKISHRTLDAIAKIANAISKDESKLSRNLVDYDAATELLESIANALNEIGTEKAVISISVTSNIIIGNRA